MRMLRLAAALALLASPALAQNGTVTNHAFAVGKGPGVTGFTSLLCTSAQLAVGQAAADPICQTLTGDVTLSAGGVTAIGATVVHSSMLNADVFSTAHSWAGQQTFTAPILGTPASGTLTNATGLPISTGISGLATGVATFLATPSSANLRAALTDEVGTGAAYFVGGALGTPASATLTNGTGLPLTGLAAQGANTLVANATAGSASPTAIAVPSCSSASSALTWTTSTGFGCNSITGGGGGAWNNTRLAKIAAYATVTGDCGSTLALGGAAFYAATLNAPSGYASNCAFFVVNEDTGRAKHILPQFATSSTSFTIGTGSKAFTTAAGLNVSTTQRYRVYSLANTANWMAGLATYSGTTLTVTVDTIGGSGTFTDWQIAPEIYIWPGQTAWVFNQNNVWEMSSAQRWLLPGRGITYELCYAQNGSDSNDGLGAGSGCLAHVQTAVNIIGTQWDGGGYNNCAIGIYAGGTNIINESVAQTGSAVGCYLTLNFRGAVTWQNTGVCWNAGDGSILVVNTNLGFVPTYQCNSSNAASSGQFYGHQWVIFDFFGPFQWFPGGTNDTFLFLDAQGRATFDGSAKNIGSGAAMSARSLLDCDSGCAGIGVSGSWNFSANVSLGQAYIIRNGGYINTTATYTAAPTPSAPTTTPIGGSRLLTNGTTIPGGTTSGTLNGLVCTSVC